MGAGSRLTSESLIRERPHQLVVNTIASKADFVTRSVRLNCTSPIRYLFPHGRGSDAKQRSGTVATG